MFSTRSTSLKYQDSVQTIDMPIRKKMVLYLALLLLVLLWFIGIKNRDPQQYDSMRKTLELYENQGKSINLRLRQIKSYDKSNKRLDALLNCHGVSPLKESKEHLRRIVIRECTSWDPELPVIYVITPTFARLVQKAELTRLSHTFMLVQNLHWIVVEDADHKSTLVADLLANTHLNYTHLNEPTPPSWKHKPKEPNWVKPRGVMQRNRALAWLRANLNANVDKGVVYFADDDNSYSLQVFEEMRHTREVSVWPVGLVGGLMVEGPVVNRTTGRVVGWTAMWRPERPFPVDMAGFAINLRHLLLHPEVKFLLEVKAGWQESELLSHLTTWDRLEPMADGCTKVNVWHTRTEVPKPNFEDKYKQKHSGKGSDFGIEV